ncbi:MAG: zinc ABC transporter substrate-binding protein [Planctomycetota bacterium]|nr:MAG: zinc ABC transporter substrate-binding protein [Planctomycetota bacterium]
MHKPVRTRNPILPIAASALVVALGASPRSSAADENRRLEVVCTLPHLASLTEQIGGERVHVETLSDGRIDPHFVVPTPGLMARASKADLFVEVGASLELWTERVIDGARNPRIRVGQPGHVYAYEGVRMIEVPKVMSRAGGDVHPQGNPHIWFDPYNAIVMARNIAAGLQRVDPAGESDYKARLAAFEQRVAEAYFGPELLRLLGPELLWRLQRSGKLRGFLEKRRYKGKPLGAYAGGWLGRMWPHRGTPFVSYHRMWGYFARAFFVEQAGQLEPKPGIPPTPGHLADLEASARARGVRIVLCAPYYDLAKARAFAKRIGGRAVEFPTEPHWPEQSWFDLLDTLTKRFAEAAETAR